jgi:GNAT superfamily N-acetyltransferase
VSTDPEGAHDVTGRQPLPIRAVTDADAPALIGLIGAAYDEHPGCVLDLPGVDDDLPEPATAAARRGGRWWVVVDGEEVVASVGTGPVDEHGVLELKRMYVAASHRRRGLASRLVQRVESHAAGLGAAAVELWSDTRFADAHRFYARHGYRDTGGRRQLHDPSDTTEIHFLRRLEPAAPRRRVVWDGPLGPETCALVDLPDGLLLRGEVERLGLNYRVEIDAAGRTRTATIDEPGGRRRLATDGEGRWWLDGDERANLAGCRDVDIEATAATKTLPIRRTLAGGAARTTTSAVWVRVPGPGIVPSSRRYELLGPDRWRYASGDVEAELTLDADGLVLADGRAWDAVVQAGS